MPKRSSAGREGFVEGNGGENGRTAKKGGGDDEDSTRAQPVMGNYNEALERIKEKLLEMESDMNHIVHMNNQMACRNQELVVLNAMKDKFIDTHLKMGCTFFPPPDEGNDNDTSDSSD